MEVENSLSFLQELQKKIKTDLGINTTGNIVISCEKDDVKYTSGHQVFYNHIIVFKDDNTSFKVEFYFNSKYEVLSFTTDGFEMFSEHKIKTEDSIVILKDIDDFFRKIKSSNKELNYDLCSEIIVG